MQALATFIVKSRSQAAISALLGSLLPMIAPATVGLIALSQNSREAIMVMLWACLVPIAITNYGAIGADLTLLVTCFALLTVFIAALVLKATNAWSLTILVVIATSALSALIANSVVETTSIIAAIDQWLATNGIKLPEALNTQVIIGLVQALLRLKPYWRYY